jgi:hypothetical protein
VPETSVLVVAEPLMPLIVSFASQFRRMGATRGVMVIDTVLSLHGLDELVLMATFHEGSTIFIISVPVIAALLPL